MSDRACILSEIAGALGVPAETFVNVSSRADMHLALVEECIELIEAFQHIADRQARRRCLSYVKATAKRSSEEA